MRLFLHPLLIMTEPRGSAPHADGHPTSEAIAAFVDRCVNGTERDLLLAHFASCAECRREMTDVRTAVNASSGRRGVGDTVITRWPVLMASVAAALLLAVGLPRLTPERAASPALVTRTPAAQSLTDPASLVVVSPVDGDTLPEARVLAWRAGGADATYEITVQDSTGALVWSATLADTTAVMPDSARLVGGARYFWSVDVRRADGGASRSGVHRFFAR